MRNRDGSALLRDHDGNGIAFLRCADGSPVPEAQLPICQEGGGERKHARGSYDPPSPYDDGPVVQHRMGVKNGQQQVRGDDSIKRHATIDKLLQPRLALQHDQRAVASLGKAVAGLCNRGQRSLQDILVARGSAEQRPSSSHALQCPAELLLKDDRDRHEQCRERFLCQPGKGTQAYQATQQGDDDDEENHTAQQWDSAGAAHQIQDPEEYKGHQQDVEGIYPVEALQVP